MINVADNIPISGIDTKLFDLDGYKEVCKGPNISDRYFANRAWVAYFFEPDRTKYIVVPNEGPEKDRLQKLFKKGDLIRYPSPRTHISIMHSDRPSAAGHYEIIHASGSNSICYRPAPGMPEQCFFNRKVVINLINDKLTSTTLKNPTGFGRVKLWD